MSAAHLLLPRDAAFLKGSFDLNAIQQYGDCKECFFESSTALW
jgi:hypothetical protein